MSQEAIDLMDEMLDDLGLDTKIVPPWLEQMLTELLNAGWRKYAN